MVDASRRLRRRILDAFACFEGCRTELLGFPGAASTLLAFVADGAELFPATEDTLPWVLFLRRPRGFLPFSRTECELLSDLLSATLLSWLPSWCPVW